MIKGVLLAILASSLSLGASQNTRVHLNSVTLENGGNGFHLTDTTYATTDSFVYTAVANFEFGQACGLVIGGNADNGSYYVFNVDRYENSTKLIQFYKEMGEQRDRVLFSDHFIGNNKVTESELNVIKPKVRELGEFNFKVVVSRKESETYGEFYIDNIKRFGVDLDISLSSFDYGGGKLGFNVFNGKVTFNDIHVGKNDYTYYTEPYRNQFHYSQYAHWNNDPNGLVYYNGYYHMFYQTHPFSKYWDHMYWGHARSRDLIHWQELPIALFPDDGTMGKGLGVGYAWSGIAMVYHKGMSAEIDSRNWFPNGDGDGLIGYYTRDGLRQDQILISSDDEGLTWTKQELISQHLVVPDRKVDCRDPSLVPLKYEGNKVTLWGMVLSGGTQDKFWFLKSTNMVNWEYAGVVNYVYPECITAAKLKADDNSSHYILSVSSRYYTVGDFVYNDETGLVEFYLTNGRNIKDVPQNQAFRPMEYGEDSYAMQCFYIDDENSEYYGKNVGLSWYSGLPSDAESGIYAEVRHPWNGGGMTTPVEFGLKKVGTDYVLTQKPIIETSTHVEKTSVANVSDLAFNNESNPLSDVDTHLFELKATIENPNKESIEFVINANGSDRTSFGWTKTEGYFFDRTKTSKAGINFVKHYSHRFVTGPVDGNEQSFYVLSDNGGVEIFAGDYQYTFYNLTLSAPHSVGAELHTSGAVTVKSLAVNSIKSIWHDPATLEEGKLYVPVDNLVLDTKLTTSKELMAYSSNNSQITFEVSDGSEKITLENNPNGVTVNAVSAGTATIRVSANGYTKDVNVTIHDGKITSDVDFDNNDIYSGDWYQTTSGLLGIQNQGDGYLISDVLDDDMTYSATFDVRDAAAAGLVIRANKDMSQYLVANYDRAGEVSKIWSQNGVLAEAAVHGVAPSSVTLTVKAEGRNVELYVNGSLVLSTLIRTADPLSGYLGVNVYNGRALVNEIHLLNDAYSFENKDLVIEGGTSQYIKNIYNYTEKNSLVARQYYSVDESKITLKKEYFELLQDNTTYKFFIEGAATSFTIKVKTGVIERSLKVEDLIINEGQALNIFVGQIAINSVSINGSELEQTSYEIKDYVLHIDGSMFALGNNEVKVNDSSFTVTVNGVREANASNNLHALFNGNYSDVILFALIGLLVASIGGLTFMYFSRRKQRNG